MALFNEILVGRFNRYLQKLFSMKGGPPAAQLATEITPSIMFNTNGRENHVLESWFMFGAGLSRTPSAGNIQSFRLRNPATSGVIGVVELLAIQQQQISPAQVSYVNNPSTGDLVITEALMNMDTRGQRNQAIGAGASLVLSSGISAAGIVGRQIIQACSIAAGGVLGRDNLITTDHQEIVIDPGSFVQIDSTNAAQKLVIDIWWRERALEDSELKG